MPKIRISNSQSSSENASSSDGQFLQEVPETPQKTRRELNGNWLKGYAEYTKESESPESYHLWTGLSVLASAVRRNVWLDQGIYTLYPHLFVILVGPPGRVAKSTTIRLGRTLLFGVPQIKFGPDSVTREELIRVLENAGKDSLSAALTLHSTELSSLIDPSGINMVQFLTDIYDGDVKWQYSTKGSGRNDIKNPVLNLLAGTTPSYIADGLPVQAVEHGFTSRAIFVYEDNPRFLNPFPKSADKALVKTLINDLNHIAMLKGPFVWEGEVGEEGSPGYVLGPAKETYKKYYELIYNTRPPDFRVEGYHNRKKNHLLKVAMLLSIAESDDLVIRPRDLDTAWTILNATEKKMLKAFSAVGKYQHASDLERILAEITDCGEEGMPEHEIFDRHYAAGDVDQINKMILMLQQMGKIVKVKFADGSFGWRRR